MRSTVKRPLIAAFIVGFFSIVGTGLVKLTNEQTQDKITANERAALLRSLLDIVPQDLYNNDIAGDTLVLDVPVLGDNKPITIYRARSNGHPRAAVFTTIAPDGYSGKIKLLVAVDTQATILGIRVISHKETPGLGDAIEVERSDWVLDFTGKSMASMTENQWAVKRDGGDFDQFTGATITPRAIVKAVKNTLIYFHQNQAQLFDKIKT